MKPRDKSPQSTKELISSAVKAADPGQMRIFLERNARAKVDQNQSQHPKHSTDPEFMGPRQRGKR